eukprot:1178767-Prorocentrum_minimum.AAC.1
MTLTTNQSDAGSMGIFSRWTNQTQEARVYSHDGPIGAPGSYAHLHTARIRTVSSVLRPAAHYGGHKGVKASHNPPVSLGTG